MSDPELNEAGKRELEAGKAAKAQSLKEFDERTKGKPTPTQEENDRAALGEHIVEHEADGAEPDPGGMTNKQLEAGRGGGSYQTRQSQAQPAHRGSSPPQQSKPSAT